MSNIRNSVVCIFQEFFAYINSFSAQIIHGRDSVIFCEFMTQIILVQMTERRQMIKVNILTIVRIKIAFNISTFLTGVLCGDQFKRRICNSLKLQNQNVQQVVADFFVSFGLFIQFLKKRVKIKQQIRFFFSAVKNTVLFLIIKRKTHSFYAYGEITERRCSLGDFCVVDMRIDNDQIIFGNRIDLIFKQKFTVSVPYIK